MSEATRPTVRELVLVPAIITLAVTALRLVGELQGWSPRFFNRSAGGGGAVVGIVWLVFVFGAWFGWRLARAGTGPASVGRAFGFTVLGIVVVAAVITLTVVTKMNPFNALGLIGLAFLAGAAVAWRGWPELGRTMFVYALAARVPVAAVMLVAILGHWGTHYDVAPPNLPPMGPVKEWALIGLFPQMTAWIGFTVLGGMLAGAIAGAVARGRSRESVATTA